MELVFLKEHVDNNYVLFLLLMLMTVTLLDVCVCVIAIKKLPWKGKSPEMKRTLVFSFLS